MHRYRASTAGERLCQFIHEKLEDERAWRHLLNAIRPVGDSIRLTAYYRHHAALFLACKLVSAGKSISTTDGGSTAALLPIVEQFPWIQLNAGNRLLRMLADAVDRSDRPISPGAASELRAYAREHHRHCYICGTPLDFGDSKSRAYCTAEHLWPSSYGGDSVEENLLPACADCNTKRGNLATWVASDVHALFLGLDPDITRLRQINFIRRYALYHRAAINLAIARGLTLKNAFLRLGPWNDPRVSDVEATADMFNLKTHREIEEEYEEV